jgi:hypothetical protein
VGRRGEGLKRRMGIFSSERFDDSMGTAKGLELI